MDNLAQKAITAALTGKWNEAKNFNTEILKDNPNDVDALNRLARAYAELGNIDKAKNFSEKVLKIDPFNTIAEKATKKWRCLKSSSLSEFRMPCSETFLEEPGKTKILPLIHLGDANVIGKLDSGDEVKLTPHSHRVSVITQEGKYIGRLPDDLSAKLRFLIKQGNEYSVLVKSTRADEVKIFIRETKRCKKMADVASFPPEKIDYVAFTPPELIINKESPVTEEADEEG